MEEVDVTSQKQNHQEMVHAVHSGRPHPSDGMSHTFVTEVSNVTHQREHVCPFSSR